MAGEYQPEECFFPPCEVTRAANLVLLQCESEDDAIVMYELFRDVSLGHSISFRAARSDES